MASVASRLINARDIINSANVQPRSRMALLLAKKLNRRLGEGFNFLLPSVGVDLVEMIDRRRLFLCWYFAFCGHQ